MKPPTVVSLCDRTGNMVLPWLEAGHHCMIVDTQHAPGLHSERVGDGLLTKVGRDVRGFTPPADTGIVFAFPPCTNLAVSGAAWFKDKGLRGLIDGLELVEACRSIAEQAGVPWMLENPMSTLSTYWRKPDWVFNPHEYGGYLLIPGDAYTKRTCLWVGNGFRVPPKRSVDAVEGSKMHRLGPSEERANLRSETPMGFAYAVFEANHQLVQERAA